MSKQPVVLPSEELNKKVGTLDLAGNRTTAKKISYSQFKELAKQAEKTFNFDEPHNGPAISL